MITFPNNHDKINKPTITTNFNNFSINVAGFRLASLNRLADTKSSAAKGTTLLHYLVQILEKKFKDVLRLDEDIPHVRDAAKVSLGELGKDMAQLRAGLKDVAREIEFHRTQSPLANDRFVPVMREFQATATCRLAEIEDQYQDMKVNCRGTEIDKLRSFTKWSFVLFG